MPAAVRAKPPLGAWGCSPQPRCNNVCLAYWFLVSGRQLRLSCQAKFPEPRGLLIAGEILRLKTEPGEPF